VQARRRQPWCTDCHTSENLTVHHTPAAWQKVATGNALTLNDFSSEDPLLTILCQTCNNRRGAAR
jgi:5-methylcytosine-specific restriction enzyme A